MKFYGYRKMFGDLEPHRAKEEALKALALLMSGRTKYPAAVPASKPIDALKNDKMLAFHGESKSVPAGYTYLGQFIAHEIAFDKQSDRHRRSDLPFDGSEHPISVGELKNLRRPTFDLETIYGQVEPVNRLHDWVEPARSQLKERESSAFLKLGQTQGAPSLPNDLFRELGDQRAVIADKRNDENVILAQTQVAFIKFHNAIVRRLKEMAEFSNDVLFEKARKLAIRYFQTIVRDDYLPRFVDQAVLEEVEKGLAGDAGFYKPTEDDLFMPLEFSVAAFRFGHSMIRPTYNLNRLQTVASLRNLMAFTGPGKMNDNPATDFLLSSWTINWYNFYDLNGLAVNRAETIDTNLPPELLNLHSIQPSAEKPEKEGLSFSIAAIDLFRGFRFELPSGQDIANFLKPGSALSEDEIRRIITDRKMTEPSPDEDKKLKFEKDKELCLKHFVSQTPLWFYVLAEAESQNDGRLGPVGGRIVAETFLKLLYLSEYSVIKEKVEPENGTVLELDEENFAQNYPIESMSDMLNFIRQTNSDLEVEPYSDEIDDLNPLGNQQ